MKLNKRETATVLAALRAWQTSSQKRRAPRYDDIATDHGDFDALTDLEIDSLCERINFDDSLVVPKRFVRMLTGNGAKGFEMEAIKTLIDVFCYGDADDFNSCKAGEFRKPWRAR